MRSCRGHVAESAHARWHKGVGVGSVRWLLPRVTGTAADAEDLLETSVPGIFAAGDVRSGSTKRCAAAVGEGAMTVQFIHAHLAERARNEQRVT